MGGARTFAGLYYFKTDLAAAMAFAIALMLFRDELPGALRAAVFGAASCMLFLSNARAYYFVWAAMLLFYVQMRRSRRVTVHTFLLLAALVVGVLFALRALASTELFQGLGFISFQFDSLEDLFDSANTQGRNYVFAVQMGIVSDSPLVAQLFGSGYTGDQVYVNGSTYGAHSLYVGTLFNLGVVGLAVLLAYLTLLTLRAARLSDPRLRYLVLSLAATFLLAGLSVDVLQYTANSWLPFFFLGCADALLAQGRTDRWKSSSLRSSALPSSEATSLSCRPGA